MVNAGGGKRGVFEGIVSNLMVQRKPFWLSIGCATLLLLQLSDCTSLKREHDRGVGGNGAIGGENGVGGSSGIGGRGGIGGSAGMIGGGGGMEGECSEDADCEARQCFTATCVDNACAEDPSEAGTMCGSGQVCTGDGACSDCVPGRTTCADKFRVKTCSQEGHWSSPASCTGQACYQDACRGSCVPGNQRCTDTQVETCSDQGAWAPSSDCSAMGLICSSMGSAASCVCPASPAECTSGATTQRCTGDTSALVCSSDAQGCIVSHPMPCGSEMYCWMSTTMCALPKALGYANALGGSGNKSSGYLLGQSVVVSAASTIRAFGLLVPSVGSMVSMGLYTDVGGLPHQLVAKAESQAVIATVPQVNEYPAGAATGGSLQLAPGTYWIMALFDVTTVTEGAPAEGETTTIAYVAAGWGSLPDTLSDPGTQPNVPATNYYILVTE